MNNVLKVRVALEVLTMFVSIFVVISVGCKSANIARNTGNNKTDFLWYRSAVIGNSSILVHKGMVKSVDVSPDAKLIASGSDDGTLVLWDAVTGAEITHFGPFDSKCSKVNWIDAVAFSPDGEMIFCIDLDGVVRKFDVSKRVLVSKWGEHVYDDHYTRTDIHEKTNFDFSQIDNSILFWTDFRGKRILIRDLNGSLIDSIAISIDPEYVHFSRDGTKIICCDGKENGIISVIDRKTKQEVRRKNYIGSLHSITCSPVTDTVAFATSSIGGGRINLWNYAVDENLPGFSTTDPGPPLVYSPNGKILISREGRSDMNIWISEDGVHGRLKGVLKGHNESIVSAVFFPDNEKFVTGSANFVIRIWDSKNLKEIAMGNRLNLGEIITLRFSEDGRQIFSWSKDNSIRAFDCKTGQQISMMNTDSIAIVSAQITPDCKWAVCGDQRGLVRIFSLQEGRLEAQSQTQPPSWVSAKVSDDRNIMVIAAMLTVAIMDVTTQTVIAEVEAHNDGITGIDISRDGKVIASCSRDGTVVVFELEGKKQKILEGHKGAVTAVALSPDSQIIASTGSEGKLIIWSREKGAMVESFQCQKYGATALSFSPDGRYVAAVGQYEERVLIWDMLNHKLETQLHTNAGGLVSVQFSPDGSCLAAGGKNGTITIWRRSQTK